MGSWVGETPGSLEEPGGMGGGWALVGIGGRERTPGALLRSMWAWAAGTPSPPPTPWSSPSSPPLPLPSPLGPRRRPHPRLCPRARAHPGLGPSRRPRPRLDPRPRPLVLVNVLAPWSLSPASRSPSSQPWFLILALALIRICPRSHPRCPPHPHAHPRPR